MHIQVLLVQPLNTVTKKLFPYPPLLLLSLSCLENDQIDWTDEEIIKLLNWVENHLDMLHQPPRWSKLCKLEQFGQNENITVERIKYKSSNMKTLQRIPEQNWIWSHGRIL